MTEKFIMIQIGEWDSALVIRNGGKIELHIPIPKKEKGGVIPETAKMVMIVAVSLEEDDIRKIAIDRYEEKYGKK